MRFPPRDCRGNSSFELLYHAVRLMCSCSFETTSRLRLRLPPQVSLAKLRLLQEAITHHTHLNKPEGLLPQYENSFVASQILQRCVVSCGQSSKLFFTLAVSFAAVFCLSVSLSLSYTATHSRTRFPAVTLQQMSYTNCI